MSEEIHIPRILRDREGPSIIEKVTASTKETVTEYRKKISKKMARYIADITFDKSSVARDEYDEDNPDKFAQDLAFATYEPNLRESHYNDQQRKLHTLRKKVGSYVMMTPGFGLIKEHIDDAKLSRRRVKDQQKKYTERNGTFKSHLREKYIAHVQEFSE